MMNQQQYRSDYTIRILGCGNPLMGDDGIGIHVINRLSEMREQLPDDVELLDAGVSGLDILNLLEGTSKVIIVDAVKGAGESGSIHRLSVEDMRTVSSADAFSVHDTSLADVLAIAEHVQQMPEHLTIFAIEIEKADEISLTLSEKVQDAVEKAANLILDELTGMEAY